MSGKKCRLGTKKNNTHRRVTNTTFILHLISAIKIHYRTNYTNNTLLIFVFAAETQSVFAESVVYNYFSDGYLI